MRGRPVFAFPILLCLCAYPIPAGTIADDSSDAEALFKQAHDLTDIRAEGSPPFRLVARIFTYDTKGRSKEGTYTLIWKTPISWRDETIVSDFSQVRVASGESIYTVRNQVGVSPAIFSLDGVLDFPYLLRTPSESAPRSLHEGVENKEGSNVLLKRGNLSVEVRMEASLPLPTRLFPMVRSGELRFDHYVELGSRRYPTVLSESVAGKLLLRAEVQELKAQAPDESALSPPKDALARPWCPHPKPAVSTWDRMPEALTMGRTFIYGVIGADGRWYNIDVVDSSHNSWPPARPFQQYLSSSKTEPATCEGRPVPSEVIVQFGR